MNKRIEEKIENVEDRISVGNIYINRKIIGEVVGVKNLGGSGI